MAAHETTLGTDPTFSTDAACATRLDELDPLAAIRSEFVLPKTEAGDDKIYLVGNSLGALPVRARSYLDLELDRWGQFGVEGHFEGETAWEPYHELLTNQMAALVGGGSTEVVVMNSLTVNLHLLMVSFYQPTPQRHKILIEDHAFPSDHFAVESQIRQRGFDPAQSMVVMSPREGEQTLRTEDIMATIAEHGSELSLVMLPGVQYYTGQVLPMADIVAAGHAVGAKVGFDLAHAVGNIELALHDWDVDFAAWCTYKYLNSGPGGVAACFVHQRHVADPDLPKFTGWWGTNKSTRFEMLTNFDAIESVESWQLSNAPILSMASLRASLDVIDLAGGIGAMRAKSELQIRYLDFLLDSLLAGQIESLTPRAMEERGCQFALRVVDPSIDGRQIYEQLKANGVSLDWRYPDVIRIAAVPLYNTFEEIYRFVETLERLLQSQSAQGRGEAADNNSEGSGQ